MPCCNSTQKVLLFKKCKNVFNSSSKAITN
jgi:hypothetical protein